MPPPAPSAVEVPTAGGSLRVLLWGTGTQTILALHGISACAMAWGAVAARLPPGWRLAAPDLRGRGHSAHLPGPYGFDRHVSDVAAVIEHLNVEPVLTGHSMGAYLALLTHDEHPGLVSRLVLLDGGLPLPVPPGADPDALLDLSLGPAIARLGQTFATADAYVDFWRAHPAFIGAWNADAEAYVRYDLAGDNGSLRSRAVAAAVREDGRDLLLAGERIGGALARLTRPTVLVTAPRGLLGEPPGIQPPDLVSAWRRRAPLLRPQAVPGVNHYTLLFSPGSAGAVARVLAGTGPD